MYACGSLCALHACNCPRTSAISGSLKLGLEAVMSYPIWVLGTATGSSAKAGSAPNC